MKYTKKHGKPSKKKDSNTFDSESEGFFHKMRFMFICPLGHKHHLILLFYFTTISLLEFAAYTIKGVFSIAAAWLWILGGIVTFFSVALFFVSSVKQDFLNKKILSLCAILLVIIYLLTLPGNINMTEINPDAAQQAAAGLESFGSIDFNYTEKAFLGYPSRQYIIAALPAFLFGRSITTLHMGFALPFIFGIMLLYCALRKWAEKLNIETSLAVLPIYVLFVFPFVTEYYVNFEQAIFPIALTMMAIGFFLLFILQPNIINILGLAWVCCLFSNSYTPGLASLGLMVVFIGIIIYLYIKKTKSIPLSAEAPIITAKSLILVEVNVISFFIATLFASRSDRITEIRPVKNVVLFSGKSIYDFLLDENAAFFGMLGIFIIIYIVASITFRLKTRDFLISLWVMGVFIASNLLSGYTSYQPAWIMQRALVVIPVIVVEVSLLLFEKISTRKLKVGKEWIVIIALSFSLAGLNNFKQINQSFTYFNHVQPMKYMIRDLDETAKSNELNSMSRFNIVLYTDNIMIKNLSDYCKFFYPNAKVFTPENHQFPHELNQSLTTLEYSDMEIFPENESDLITYKNDKHNMEVIWFRRITKK